MEDRITIGKTKEGATITVCTNCNAYTAPHFNYNRCNKRYSFEFERAVPLDHGNLMDLRERTDLESFFATYNKEYQMTNWKLAIKNWNENNNVQIPLNLHKPYYRNMVEENDYFEITTLDNRQDLLDGMHIYCNEDSERDSHFHIKLPDDVEVALYFDKAEYLFPISRNLTPKEVDALVTYLESECNKFITEKFKLKNNCQYLIYAWNNQNAYSEGYIELDCDLEMPNYIRSNENGIKR